MLWVPLVPVSVALAVVDWRTRLLPTAVLRPTYGVLVVLVLLGWAVTGDSDAVVRAALGWLVAGGLFAILWFIYPRGLGFGDVRLAGLLGIGLGWVGWGTLLVGVYAGFLLGGVIGGLLALLRVVERKGVPFGPFMLLGALIGLIWGEPLWSSLVSGWPRPVGATPHGRLTPCCAGSLLGSPTAPPWSPSWRGCRRTSRSPPTTSPRRSHVGGSGGAGAPG